MLLLENRFDYARKFKVASFREWAATKDPYEVTEAVNYLRGTNRYDFTFDLSVGPDGKVYGAGHHYRSTAFDFCKRKPR